MNWVLLLVITLAPQAGAVEKQATPTEKVQANTPSTTTEPLKQELPEYQPPAAQPPVGATSFIKVFGSLLMVIGLIGFLAYGIKRWLPSGFKAGDGNNHFKFIQNFPLGQRKFLALVEVDGRKLLLGITDHQINLLKSFDEFQFGEAIEEMDPVKTVSELLKEKQGVEI